MPIELFKKLDIRINDAPLKYHHTSTYKTKTVHIYRSSFVFSLHLNIHKFITSNNLHVYNLSPELYINSHCINFDLTKSYSHLHKNQISADLNNILNSKGDLLMEYISDIKKSNNAKIDELNTTNEFIDLYFSKYMILL